METYNVEFTREELNMVLIGLERKMFDYHGMADELEKQYKILYDKLYELIYNPLAECPLCGSDLYWVHYKNTHIYYCDSCPFHGFEFVDEESVNEYIEYLKDKK